jgi:dinuclear metal center YbgI/SA1388 family protein
VTRTPTLADVVTRLESLYPRRWAQPGDPVGLVVGDPAAVVRRIHFAVDPVQVVIDEAVVAGADLLVVHHPLLFRAVHTVAADTPKGRVVHDLIAHGIGLYVAHTNADSPPRGVSESMARALGLDDLQPLEADPADPTDKLVTFVPHEHTQQVIDALAEAGAGDIGAYERCAYLGDGHGTFRPGSAASPMIGTAGRVELVEEHRVEMVVPRARRVSVVAALRRVHPYDEPAFDVYELAGPPARRGTGRVGRLPAPMTLRDFADRVAAALPATAVGARVSGDLDRQVETVALVGGAGDSMLDAARASGADVYVTSDLRHHPASEAREHRDALALIDVPHWAAEWTWLPVAEETLQDSLREHGFTAESVVSRTCTDPWNYRAASRAAT